MLCLLLAACDGTLGCLSCGQGYQYPEPAPPGGAYLPDTLVAHLQEGAVRFAAEHLSDIMRARFPVREAGGIERAVIFLDEATVGGDVSLTIRDGRVQRDR